MLLVTNATLKKLHLNRHLLTILGDSKLRLSKAILKHGVDREFINLISELYLILTEGSVQLSLLVKEQTTQHRSLVHALAAAAKNKGTNFKRKQLLQAGGNFSTLLLTIVLGFVKSFV